MTMATFRIEEPPKGVDRAPRFSLENDPSFRFHGNSMESPERASLGPSSPPPTYSQNVGSMTPGYEQAYVPEVPASSQNEGEIIPKYELGMPAYGENAGKEISDYEQTRYVVHPM